MLSPNKSFILLVLIFLTIIFINVIYIKKFEKKNIQKSKLINRIIGSIFLLFSISKLINLNSFVNIYKKYDIISQLLPIYAYFYPFIELYLAKKYLFQENIKQINKFTMVLMLISIISVFITLFKGDTLRCGCLGSMFHIPLSYITLSENIMMLLMMVI